MKVALIGQKGIPCTQGGIERYAEELSAHLAERGLDVIAYTRPYYTDPTLKEHRGVRLVSLKSIKTKHFDALSHSLFATLHAILIEKVDALHFQNVGPGFWAWIPRILTPRVKIIATFQSSDWDHEKWGAFAKFSLKLGAWSMCKFAHSVFAVSQEIQAYAREHYKKHLPIITNGVHIPKSLNKATRAKELKRFGLKQDNYIFSASRLIRHKGIHYLIDAFTRIKEQQDDSDLKLVIAGDGFHTDNYVTELRKIAKDRNDILFIGSHNGDTLQALFEGSRVFVLPSEAEGLSLVLLEALGYGLVTVVSDIAPNMESISSRDHADYVALYFENKNVADLAERLNNALKEESLVFSKKAQDHVAKHFNWNTIADQIIDLYNKDKEEYKYLAAVPSPTFSNASIQSESDNTSDASGVLKSNSFIHFLRKK